MEDLLNEARELLNAITPQPWEASGNGVHKGIHAVATTHATDRMQRVADAAFIARAPELLRQLADEVEVLRTKLNDPCLVAGYHVCGGKHDLSQLAESASTTKAEGRDVR